MGEWRDISGFEGRYQVSSAGQVRSLDRVLSGKTGAPGRRLTGRELKLARCTNGYLRVWLGKGAARLVHRLVASAFVSGFEEWLEVNHKNGIRADNRAENLEWVTRGENHRHSYRELSRKSHSLALPIIGISLQDGSGLWLRHGGEASRYGFNQVEVLRASRGGKCGTHYHGGFVWFRPEGLDIKRADRVVEEGRAFVQSGRRDAKSGRLVRFPL